ncbi:MAG: hypothetical protein ACLP3C_29290 [Mycobacterium sp.]|uniref:hypothetical protein n=1 Tax=Mycobacterium sp. TaxID=1785 RepID=UPI003F961684
MTTPTTDDEDEASSAADGRTPNTVRVPVRTEGLFGAGVYAKVAGQWDTWVWHDVRLGPDPAGDRWLRRCLASATTPELGRRGAGVGLQQSRRAPVSARGHGRPGGCSVCRWCPVGQAAGVGHVLAADAILVDTDTLGVAVQWSETSNADDFAKNLIHARCEGTVRGPACCPFWAW